MRSIHVSWWRTYRVLKSHQVVTISITALQLLAVLVRDALNHTTAGLDVKTACCAYRYPAYMRTYLLSCGHYRFNHISRRKALDCFAAHQEASCKTKLIQARTLIASSACTFNL